MSWRLGLGALVFSLLGVSTAQAAIFLDLSSVTPGGPGVGTFSGALGGITVLGSITGPPAFVFNGVGPGIGNSTIDGSSPQFSSSAAFSPTALGTDRVGFTYSATATTLVTMSFSTPVTDPVFHVANINWAGFSFGPTAGLAGLTLLNGNNGLDGDGVNPTFGGLPYGSVFVFDGAPATADATLPFGSPPIAGPRSAYASVQLNGTFTSISFAVDALGPFSDDGSFTVSIVPEPDAMLLAGMALLGFTGFRRRLGCFNSQRVCDGKEIWTLVSELNGRHGFPRRRLWRHCESLPIACRASVSSDHSLIRQRDS